MIENKNEANRNLEKALRALEQAKQRVANEKKNRTRADNIIGNRTKRNRRRRKFNMNLI